VGRHLPEPQWPDRRLPAHLPHRNEVRLRLRPGRVV